MGTLLLVLFVAIFIATYVAAQKLSRTTDCVILYGKIDVMLIMVSYIVVALSGEVGYYFRLATICLLCLLFLATSIIPNLMDGSICIRYTLVAFVTKCIFSLISPLIITTLLIAMSSGKVDNRYRDGTRNNERTKKLWRVVSILNPLFFDLIKPEEDKWWFVKKVFNEAGANYDE